VYLRYPYSYKSVNILWRLCCRSTVNSGNARQTTRDMFSMWSDPSLLRNNWKAAFSTGSVQRQQQPMQQWVFSLWSVHGLYSRAATGTELVSNGNGRHKSQQLSREFSSYEFTIYEWVFRPSSSLQRRVAGERILRYWKRGNEWRYSVKTRQVL
jgi:hypothetical protein